MQVNVKNGQAIVKLNKLEQKKLLDAANVLSALDKFAVCQRSAVAWDALSEVIKHYAPSEQEKSETPARSKASAEPLPY